MSDYNRTDQHISKLSKALDTDEEIEVREDELLGVSPEMLKTEKKTSNLLSPNNLSIPLSKVQSFRASLRPGSPRSATPVVMLRPERKMNAFEMISLMVSKQTNQMFDVKGNAGLFSRGQFTFDDGF